jgi:hypothetical protein
MVTSPRMTEARATVRPCHFLWRDSETPRREFGTAVSLHSHTLHSKERLGFIPRYAERVPIVRGMVKKQEARYAQIHGYPVDYMTGWWTPPLSPMEAYDLERGQIERQLGMRALVSLTDHDDIEAPMLLHVMSQMKDVPVSLEWTVPYAPSFFHLGVHNLPPAQAKQVMEVLSGYTKNPREERLPSIFNMLNSIPNVLVVINHPLWDEPGIGEAAHLDLLRKFTSRYRQWLHAAELNGLRYWPENRGVIEYAAEVRLPLISGGDRHGCEPNGNVNVTNARSFDEFVHEVRDEGISNVLFLNHYREPVKIRLTQGLVDALRDYPEFPEGRKLWSDRVFFEKRDGTIRTLSSVWKNGGPTVVRWFVAAVRRLECPTMRTAVRRAFMEYELPEHEEVA